MEQPTIIDHDLIVTGCISARTYNVSISVLFFTDFVSLTITHATNIEWIQYTNVPATPERIPCTKRFTHIRLHLLSV